MKRGYYLVRNSDQARFFIAEKANESALEKVAKKTLCDKTGWGYWIDYCYGLDIFGNTAWSNVDHTDSFI